jgi:hypothetical protein
MKWLKLHPDTNIKSLDDVSIADFWSWAYSDVLSNTVRPLLAEFVVGHALGVVESPRIEWDACDLDYKGKKIEVKSAAYLQSWEQEKLSAINFDIEKKLGWHADKNIHDTEAKRSADCYVFCLYPSRVKDQTGVLNINSWEFYVIPTSAIDAQLKDQKSVGLPGICKLCNPPVSYAKLKERIDTILL